MIIECGSCNSRFRLDESKITGRGARVRCRKCGEPITIMKSDVAGQGEAGAGGPARKEEGLDLRSILRETMEAPAAAEPPAAERQAPEGTEGREESPAAEPAGIDSLQSELDRLMAGAGKEAEAAAGSQAVDFGPEEELTFLPPGGKETPAADREAKGSAEAATPGEEPATRQASRERTPAADAPAPSSEFVMSTADSLDFLKADYEQGEQKAALDISGSLRVAPAPGTKEPKFAPPLGTQAIPSPAAPAGQPPRPEAIRNEPASPESAGAAGTQAMLAGAAAASDASLRGRVAPPPPDAAERSAPTPMPASRRTPARTGPALKRRQSSQLVRPSVVILLVLFVALAGGGAYLGFTDDGKEVLRGLVPQIESLWPGSEKAASRYALGNLVGYYENNAAGGRMFVIKGQLTNEGKLRRTGVRVHAALLDARNAKVAEKTVYAGNVFAGEVLRKTAREKIEAAMSNPIGGGLANMDIPPGKSVPFMVVFFDAPDGIDAYRLEPRDVD